MARLRGRRFGGVLWIATFVAALAGATLLSGPAQGESTHADHAGEGDEHGGGHGEHGGAHGHFPHFDEINWYYGFFSESDDPNAEEDFVTRAKGRPVPLLAFFINVGILFYGIYRLAGGAVTQGLKDRKEGIMRGIDEASKMKDEAAAQLQGYTDKLRSIDTEIDRVRKEMADAAEAERTRIVKEAKARRERMEREARELVEHELKAMREELMLETARGAVKTAEQLLVEKVGEGDHERLVSEYLASVKTSLSQRGNA